MAVARYLLDINIISEFARPRPAATVVAFLEGQKLEDLLISDVVLAEVRFGISLVADEMRRGHYNAVLEQTIRPMFKNRILSTGEETWLIWKSLEHYGRQRRYTFPQPDLIIAALAKEHGLTVVTRDIEPFKEAGVPYFNPWEA